MLHSILITPEFVNEVSDYKPRTQRSKAWSKVLNELTENPTREIILDKNGKLEIELLSIAEKYSENAKEKTLELLEHIEVGDIIANKTDYSVDPKSDLDLIELCKKCLSTNQKSILGSKSSNFKKHSQELSNHSIYILNSDTIKVAFNSPNKILSYNYSCFCDDLIEACKYLCNTKYSKRTEDEYNDYIRDLLEFRGYTVTDQNRAGNSPGSRYKTKINVGERDLVVKQGVNDKTLIEALRLNSLTKGTISSHYSKLINDYNPLGLKDTFLVSYYLGRSSFSTFSKNYEDYITQLDKSDIQTTRTIKIGDTVKVTTSIDDISRLHIFKQKLEVDSIVHGCVHILLDLSV
ncbi:hypothetical protein [Vibrio sp. St2]|uniref:hypothetical protein n=1 Tax=Vibrio sp. St2 TaxID=2853441 RepID=UPI00248D9341|nr:hypothetical protein [Vibrio sp. St2]